MKKIVLALSIATALFGYDVIMDKTFIKEVIPSKQSVRVTITVKDKTLNGVLKKLEEYKKYMDSLKNVNIKSNGFHTLNDYNYQNNKRIKIGYKGFSNYTVSSDKQKNLEDFIEKFAKDKNTGEISLSSMQWSLSEKKKEQTIDELKIDAIKWAKKYEKTLSKELDSQCKLEEINLIQNRGISIMRAPKTLNSNLPFSEKEKKIIKIKPKLKYECE